MKHTSAIVHDPRFLSYDFGEQHPLRPERITAGLGLLEAAGVWDSATEMLAPPAATIEELELIHDPGYIRAVQESGTGWFPRAEQVRYGLASGGDTPAFPGMHEAASLITGGSIAAVREIMTGRLAHAFNPAGGLHHAMRDRASGFCVYNDPAAAAAVAVRDFGARVMYIDLDCHHGDGVQWLFYDEPHVLTVSMHETGRFLFPGTGEVQETGQGDGSGFSVNLPMAPFTDDDSWLDALNAVVPALAARFDPDLIISSHGADTHAWDPLTHLALSTRSFVDQARLIHSLAHQYASGRWLAVGSGGYDWRRVVPRSWTIVWAEMTGRSLPERIPEAWRAQWDVDPAEPMPVTFLDCVSVDAASSRADEVDRVNRDTVRAAQRLANIGPS